LRGQGFDRETLPRPGPARVRRCNISPRRSKR